MQDIAKRFYYLDGRLYKVGTTILGDDSNTNSAGYRRVCWDRGKQGRVRVLVHRLIWFMHYGEIPDTFIVDHIDGNPLNNKIENLRLTNKSGNAQNRLCNGYWLDKRTGHYYAAIKLNNVVTYIGTYTTKRLAREAYLDAKLKLHPVISNRLFTKEI